MAQGEAMDHVTGSREKGAYAMSERRSDGVTGCIRSLRTGAALGFSPYVCMYVQVLLISQGLLVSSSVQGREEVLIQE
jgi:hypothetical protein